MPHSPPPPRARTPAVPPAPLPAGRTPPRSHHLSIAGDTGPPPPATPAPSHRPGPAPPGRSGTAAGPLSAPILHARSAPARPHPAADRAARTPPAGTGCPARAGAVRDSRAGPPAPAPPPPAAPPRSTAPHPSAHPRGAVPGPPSPRPPIRHRTPPGIVRPGAVRYDRKCVVPTSDILSGTTGRPPVRATRARTGL